MNKVDYTVLPAHDIFKIQEKREAASALHRRITYVFWNVLSVVIFPIGLARLAWYGIRKLSSYAVLPGQFLHVSDPQRKLALELTGGKAVTIQTADGVKLDATVIKTDQKVKLEDQKWIVFLPGNNQCYEGSSHLLLTLAKETGANIIMPNYRGVARSEGAALSSNDLVLDGEAMVQYILNHEGGKAPNILLHGWSLGGGVATEVAALHPGMHLCSDRSFSTIAAAARYLFPGGLILGKIAALAGWCFDSVKNYEKVSGHKFMIVHRADSIIRYAASVYKNYKATYKQKPEKIKFKGISKDSRSLLGHSRPITESSGFKSYKEHVSTAFALQKSTVPA